jgi:hypothetical protein
MNNRIIFAMSFFMLTTFSALSQDKEEEEETERREDIEFGIKAGINISNVWDDRNEEFTADSKFGLAGGVFLGIPIGRFLGIQPEILFSQKGFHGSGSFLTVPYTFKRTTSFLDIPIQAQFKPTQYFTFLVGPQFSYLFHQRDEYSFGSNSTVLEEEFKNDDIRKNILGFVVGADVIYQSIVIS